MKRGPGLIFREWSCFTCFHVLFVAISCLACLVLKSLFAHLCSNLYYFVKFLLILLFLPIQTAYFQINIATSGATTHVSFVYDDDGMLWSQDWIKPRIGYTIQPGIKRETYQQILNGIGYPSTYKFHDVVGNTNFKGRWSWKLADNLDNNAAKCYDWYAKQPSENYLSVVRSHSPSDCPCLYWQIIFDRRFRFSSFSSNMICYKQRATWFFFGTSISFHTGCCYDRINRFLINDIDPSIGLATQKHLSLSYSWFLIRFSGYYRRLSRSQAVTDDTKAFEYCCQKSPLCNLYAEKRPVPTCSRYVPPIMGTLQIIILI